MAEQLEFGWVDERSMNLVKVRKDVGTSLISNSGMYTCYVYTVL